MQLDIKATNIDLTDAIRSYVQEKMDALDPKTERFGSVVRAEVEVGKTSKHHKSGEVFRAEIHVRLPGKQVYVEATETDLYAAIVKAQKEAERQIQDYKGELSDKTKRGARDARGK